MPLFNKTLLYLVKCEPNGNARCAVLLRNYGTVTDVMSVSVHPGRTVRCPFQWPEGLFTFVRFYLGTRGRGDVGVQFDCYAQYILPLTTPSRPAPVTQIGCFTLHSLNDN